MGLTLDLPAALAAELADEAARLGLSLPDYAVRLLTTARPTAAPIGTGAELVAYWRGEGVVGYRSDIADSQAHARTFREQAQRRG